MGMLYRCFIGGTFWKSMTRMFPRLGMSVSFSDIFQTAAATFYESYLTMYI